VTTAGGTPNAAASALKSSTPRRKTVSIEDIDDEDTLHRSPPPRNPKHILEGPDDNDDDEVVVSQPKRKAKAPTHAEGPKQKTAGKSSDPQKKTVSIEDIDDEDTLHRSPPPRNPKHILEGPDDDDDNEVVVLQPKRRAKAPTRAEGPKQKTAGKSSAPRKKTVSIEDIDDEDGNSDGMEVDAPEEPEESAEAELSESISIL